MKFHDFKLGHKSKSSEASTSVKSSISPAADLSAAKDRINHLGVDSEVSEDSLKELQRKSKKNFSN